MQQFCTYGSVRGASGQPVSLPRQKTHMLCCRSIVSLEFVFVLACSCSWISRPRWPTRSRFVRASPLDLF